MLLVITGHLGRACGTAKAMLPCCVLAISVILCCLECNEDCLSSSQIAWWIQGRLHWMDLMVKNWPSWLAAGWHLGEAQGGLKLPFAITGTFGSSQGTWERLASHSRPGNPRKSFVTTCLYLSWFWFCSNTDPGSLLWPLDPTPRPGSLFPAPAVCAGPAPALHPLWCGGGGRPC